MVILHNLKEVVDAIIATIKKGKIITDEKDADKKTEFVIKKINVVASSKDKDLEIDYSKQTDVGFESTITIDDCDQNSVFSWGSGAVDYTLTVSD